MSPKAKARVSESQSQVIFPLETNVLRSVRTQVRPRDRPTGEPFECCGRCTWSRDYLSRRRQMFLGLFMILLVLWLLGFFAFHVAGGLIHLLIVLAVISLVVHLVRGR